MSTTSGAMRKYIDDCQRRIFAETTSRADEAKKASGKDALITRPYIRTDPGLIGVRRDSFDTAGIASILFGTLFGSGGLLIIAHDYHLRNPPFPLSDKVNYWGGRGLVGFALLMYLHAIACRYGDLSFRSQGFSGSISLTAEEKKEMHTYEALGNFCATLFPSRYEIIALIGSLILNNKLSNNKSPNLPVPIAKWIKIAIQLSAPALWAGRLAHLAAKNALGKISFSPSETPSSINAQDELSWFQFIEQITFPPAQSIPPTYTSQKNQKATPPIQLITLKFIPTHDPRFTLTRSSVNQNLKAKTAKIAGAALNQIISCLEASNTLAFPHDVQSIRATLRLSPNHPSPTYLMRLAIDEQLCLSKNNTLEILLNKPFTYALSGLAPPPRASTATPVS